MPRRGNVPKREVLPDPQYNSVLVTKLGKQRLHHIDVTYIDHNFHLCFVEINYRLAA